MNKGSHVTTDFKKTLFNDVIKNITTNQIKLFTIIFLTKLPRYVYVQQSKDATSKRTDNTFSAKLALEVISEM